ncbi:hypothetical protein CSKR_105839 [Clonorchis sinensis]|uniref:Uncharacterized protein n=1 Tax=Clonorchis sinensis TaxID=79923 RepID=A0A419PI75_CLOSI|nr:hypothetical protein CSKR_105839 [Clonorchis sinensis]
MVPLAQKPNRKAVVLGGKCKCIAISTEHVTTHVPTPNLADRETGFVRPLTIDQPGMRVSLNGSLRCANRQTTVRSTLFVAGYPQYIWFFVKVSLFGKNWGICNPHDAQLNPLEILFCDGVLRLRALWLEELKLEFLQRSALPLREVRTREEVKDDITVCDRSNLQKPSRGHVHIKFHQFSVLGDRADPSSTRFVSICFSYLDDMTNEHSNIVYHLEHMVLGKLRRFPSIILYVLVSSFLSVFIYVFVCVCAAVVCVFTHVRQNTVPTTRSHWPPTCPLISFIAQET